MTYYAEQFWQEAKGSFINPETEVKMEPRLFGKFYLTGHVDLLSMVAMGDASSLLDWKSGYRTDADAEPQAKGYAYLAAERFASPTVRATVVWLHDQTFQTWTWTREELRAWADETAAKILKGYKTEYCVGAHCRWCPRFLNCPAQGRIVRGTLAELAVSQQPGWGKIQPARLAAMYPAVQAVERLCKTYRELTRTAVEASGPLLVGDGTQLEVKRTEPETIDLLLGWGAMTDAVHDTKALAACLKVRKAELLKAVAATAPRGQKGKVRDRLMDTLRADGAVKTSERKSLVVTRVEQADKENTDVESPDDSAAGR